MTPDLIDAQVAPAQGDRSPGPPPRPQLRATGRRPNAAQWATVLPPALVERVADTAELKAHGDLVQRVEKAAAKLRGAVTAHVAAAC
jgi:hypothetical protein